MSLKKEIAKATIEKNAKFDEIVAMVSWCLGYGHIPDLTPEKMEDAENQAEEYIDNWDEADNESLTGLLAHEPLQKLLKEHLDISEKILDLLDEETSIGSDDEGL